MTKTDWVISKTLNVITFTFLRFLTFFLQNPKNVTFYVLCFVANVFSNNAHNWYEQEAQLSLTNPSTLFYKVVEVLQHFVSENVDKKFTTDYNVA